MKIIAETLKVARSNVIERQKVDRTVRGPQTRPGDGELTAEIRRLVGRRPPTATGGSPRSLSPRDELPTRNL